MHLYLKRAQRPFGLCAQLPEGFTVTGGVVVEFSKAEGGVEAGGLGVTTRGATRAPPNSCNRAR
jgi:hypothetical protein